jgi:hypothetical protein
VTRALSSIAEPARGRFVRAWVGSTRGADGKTLVTVVWEPIPATPGLGRREAPTSVSLVAAAPDGTTFFSGSVPEPATDRGGNGDQAGAAGPASLSGGTVSFEARPGRLQLRMSINGVGGLIDSDDREFVVPDLTAPDLALGTPRVFVARTPRDYQAIRRDAGVMPTASRDFRRTDRLVIQTEPYAPGNAPVAMSARLLNRQGQRMADVPVNAPAEAGRPHVIDLPLASLAPGEYLLEIGAATEGQSPVTELIPFRVGG